MTPPTPAIVSQKAAKALPRWALLLLCMAYVIPGFVVRDPWKSSDVSAFGYMLELARGKTSWLNPLLGGVAPETDGLLPYWLGALAIQWAPAGISPDMAARLPFVGLLVLTLVATWYGVYYLARSPAAQPVAFAFGGEALPTDYARAMADGGLLALLACLGLAQLSHEATSYLVQLCCTALVFFGFAGLAFHRVAPALALVAGLAGLALAGAPTLATLLGLGGAWLLWHAPAQEIAHRRTWACATLALLAAIAGMTWLLGLWGWRIVGIAAGGKEWLSLARLLLWFGWPAWPLAIWTLWRWRKQIASAQWHRHLWLPLWFSLVSIGATITTNPADRALLLGLPAMATLAAFALPTLSRAVAALIDWFTLLFFSLSALAIWVIWIAMQTGVPAKPAANVAKLAPEFAPSFSWLALLAALAASVAWCSLVWWRASRDRAAIWKSLVLPASGAALGWLLLMTLWLPLLNHARSYVPQVQNMLRVMPDAQQGCVQTYGLSRAQTAAFQYHGGLTLLPADSQNGNKGCHWLLVDASAWPAPPGIVQTAEWTPVANVPRPTDKNDQVLVFQRTSQLAP
ncbi:4-amino-4-deoxy-L-arabinose transferase-like glycosyltransferase [Acidovorax sp. 62]|uniref:hypothetical protein n=1 Tax=Acidovorax sp. 62 TaxID=2035203 RepID=UPI000C17FA72|nr:hypothetical protein [Acidovorax sp. 62]PIF91360.1 4-amino-4-deoxy-L-arabinose transferase-like glycosyltransferase [Acidovorax sp. 62]